MTSYTVQYAVVQTKGKLCVMPSTWLYPSKWLKHGHIDNQIKELGNDKGFWPNTDKGHAEFENALCGKLVYPNAGNAKPFRCKIKRQNIPTRKEAETVMAKMKGTNDTTDNEQQSKNKPKKTRDKAINKMIHDILDDDDDYACVNQFSQDISLQMRQLASTDSHQPHIELLSPQADSVNAVYNATPKKHYTELSPTITTSSLLTVLPSNLSEIIENLQQSVKASNAEIKGSFELHKAAMDAELNKFKDDLNASLEQHKTDMLKKIVESVGKHDKSVLDAVALLSTKFDAFGREVTGAAVKYPDISAPPLRRNRPNRVLDKAMTTEDLVTLNEQAKNEVFVARVVEEMSEHFGQNTKLGDGDTVAYRLIDKFIARRVLVDSCWTGKGKGVVKLQFSELKSFMDLFFEVVKFSDPHYTTKQLHDFFRKCLSNAVSRLKSEDSNRMTSKRTRTQKNTTTNETTTSDSLDSDIRTGSAFFMHSDDTIQKFQLISDGSVDADVPTTPSLVVSSNKSTENIRFIPGSNMGVMTDGTQVFFLDQSEFSKNE